MNAIDTEFTVEPVQKHIQVKATPAAAFKAFTEEIGLWWPISQNSIDSENTEKLVLEAQEGGALYQVQKDGTTIPWGSIAVFDPPGRLVFNWHIGFAPENASEVEITFTEADNGMCDVHLTHSKFKNLSEEEAANIRDGYNNGWVNVFEVHYQDHFA